jgi:hypothetical protein
MAVGGSLSVSRALFFPGPGIGDDVEAGSSVAGCLSVSVDAV